MPEVAFLFELARAESAVVPEQVVVSRILLGPEVTLSHPDAALPPVRIGIDASAFEIAAKLREEWSVPVDDEVLAGEEVAPEHVDLSVRWREIHRDLSLTGVLRNADSRAQLTQVELDAATSSALVSGVFREREVTVALPLLDGSYEMWDAVYVFIDRARSQRATELT